MASRLSPCPSCTRHVKVGSAACPFCGGEVPTNVPLRAMPTSRPLSRAAILLAGAAAVSACGGTTSTSATDAATSKDAATAKDSATSKDSGAKKDSSESQGFPDGALMASYGAFMNPEDASFQAPYGVFVNPDASEPTPVEDAGIVQSPDAGTK